uniref:G_PROTEIN_RECEP_F1_2 domain-containing protein n=1 Tax=Rhabditophanes sp. KR3021 TaxID=114890 RepID=A0AC35UD26_9BILA
MNVALITRGITSSAIAILFLWKIAREKENGCGYMVEWYECVFTDKANYGTFYTIAACFLFICFERILASVKYRTYESIKYNKLIIGVTCIIWAICIMIFGMGIPDGFQAVQINSPRIFCYYPYKTGPPKQSFVLIISIPTLILLFTVVVVLTYYNKKIQKELRTSDTFQITKRYQARRASATLTRAAYFLNKYSNPQEQPCFYMINSTTCYQIASFTSTSAQTEMTLVSFLIIERFFATWRYKKYEKMKNLGVSCLLLVIPFIISGAVFLYLFTYTKPQTTQLSFCSSVVLSKSGDFNYSSNIAFIVFIALMVLTFLARFYCYKLLKKDFTELTVSAKYQLRENIQTTSGLLLLVGIFNLVWLINFIWIYLFNLIRGTNYSADEMAFHKELTALMTASIFFIISGYMVTMYKPFRIQLSKNKIAKIIKVDSFFKDKSNVVVPLANTEDYFKSYKNAW